MIEREEIIFCSRETREAVEEAIEVGGIEEAQRRGWNVDEIRPLHPNEIVIEKIEPEPFETAREWLDATLIICLPIWLEQLDRLKINDSYRWQLELEKREAKKNENT